MAKYNYKRDVFKGLNPFPFLGEVKTRIKEIEAAPATLPQSIFNPNKVAKALHPKQQHCIISKIVDRGGDCKSYTLVPDKKNGTEKMAFFRAGNYACVNVEINGEHISKPYTIASNPKDALGENSSYTFTIKANPEGFVSPWILKNWKEGDQVSISGPLGNFYYQELRDAKDVIGVAGGSGITMFYAMASAIADGLEDFNLTILYGSRKLDGILLKDELDAVVAKANGKVKVVHVLSDEEQPGYEHGFVTAELIQKYAPKGDYSVFVSGPKGLYDFCEGEKKKLGMTERRFRMEIPGEIKKVTARKDYPKGKKTGEYKLTVIIRGKKQKLTCKAGESLLIAMERAGVKAPSHCRSGECGWCHSRLIKGEVFVPEDQDGRRIADKKFGWIHPCVSYPLSDIEIEVFPVMD